VSERFHIGAFASLCGQSQHTIRWYEAQGLIPNVGRDGGGRRVYVREHVEHLRFLERLRRTGMTIAEMRDYCAITMQGWRTLPVRRELLKAHRLRVEAAIADLEAALEMIDTKVAYYAEWEARKKRPPDLPPLDAPVSPVRRRAGDARRTGRQGASGGR
jgi:DNA-binding transcriptional MerR regulator